MFRDFILRFLIIFGPAQAFNANIHQEAQNFSLLIDFTCAVAKDELEKHPEMRTIAMVELENNFSSEFSAEVLKCLPQDVTKLIINPHTHFEFNNTLRLPKSTMVIYVAGNINWPSSFQNDYFLFYKNIPSVSHLAKYLIVSRDARYAAEIQDVFQFFVLNFVQIYEKKRKVIARSFDKSRNLTTFESFNDPQCENLSQILWPDRTKNLNGMNLFAVYNHYFNVNEYNGQLISKWKFYLQLVAQVMNATLRFYRTRSDDSSYEAFDARRRRRIKELFDDERLDFYLSFDSEKFDLESYASSPWCFTAPVPPEYSIAQLILILPLDNPCWMWLGLTIAVSTLIWRISEGHWNFFFGMFSYFVLQPAKIRTTHLILKIILQIFLWTIFIFSNGYQSLVTSFMLNPIKTPFLTTIDEVFESNLNIEWSHMLELMHGNNPKYQKALADDRVMDVRIPVQTREWPAEVVKKNLAFTQPCKEMKYRIDYFGDGTQWKDLYLIDDVVDSLLEDLYTRPFHPFISKFQQIMDRAFEAGLLKQWEKQYFEMVYEYDFTDEESQKETERKKKILDFKSIAPFFLILAVGYVGALLALSCEIFNRDVVSELSREQLKRILLKFCRRNRKISKVKVRKIQVRPKSAKRNRTQFNLIKLDQ